MVCVSSPQMGKMNQSRPAKKCHFSVIQITSLSVITFNRLVLAANLLEPVPDNHRCDIGQVSLYIYFQLREKFSHRRGASGKRVSLFEFCRRQRRRTKSPRLMVARRKRIVKENPYIFMGLAKEKWRRRGRKGRIATSLSLRCLNYLAISVMDIYSTLM